MDYSMLQHSLSKEQYYAPETGVSQGVYHWFQTLQNTDVSAIQKKASTRDTCRFDPFWD